MEFIQRFISNLLNTAPHTVFVHFPIALCSAGFFFILLALWMKNDFYEKVAYANLCLAAVSTLVAGAMGARDNQVFFAGYAPNAMVKIILASVLFVLTTTMVLVRWRKPDLFHSRGRWLYIGGYFVSFLLVFALGFLGSIIVYGYK